MKDTEARFRWLEKKIDTLYDVSYSALDTFFGVVDVVFERARNRALARSAQPEEAAVEEIDTHHMLKKIVEYKIRNAEKDAKVWSTMLNRGVWNVELITDTYSRYREEKKDFKP